MVLAINHTACGCIHIQAPGHLFGLWIPGFDQVASCHAPGQVKDLLVSGCFSKGRKRRHNDAQPDKGGCASHGRIACGLQAEQTLRMNIPHQFPGDLITIFLESLPGKHLGRSGERGQGPPVFPLQPQPARRTLQKRGDAASNAPGSCHSLHVPVQQAVIQQPSQPGMAKFHSTIVQGAVHKGKSGIPPVQVHIQMVMD